jgi:apolipoprotein N-acyltransferase
LPRLRLPSEVFPFSEVDEVLSKFAGKNCRMDNLRQIFILILSGFLAFLSFPDRNFWFLAWIAYAGLGSYLLRCRSVTAALAGGFLFGCAQYGGLLTWVPSVMKNYGGVPGVGALLLYALLVAIQAVFPAAASGLTRLCTQWYGKAGLLLLPVFWVVSEMAQTAVPFGGFPWMLTGYSQTNLIYLLQCADFCGVMGISFLILWSNTAIVWAFESECASLHRWLPLAAAAAAVIAGLIYGRAAAGRWDSVPANLSASMLQQNISVDDPIHIMEYKFQDGYARMAKESAGRDCDLLILPESPSPKSYQYDENYRSVMQSLAELPRLGLIFNNVAYEEIDGGFRYLNSAYVLDHGGHDSGRYDKVHLVPFGEYVPLKSIFFFIESVSKDVSDFRPGWALQPVSAGGQPLGILICFEAVFPEISRSLVRGGARLLVNLSNDAWYGHSAAPYQHLAMARWRAVENRRFLLRSTNSGITAVITPSGRITSSTGLFREEICRGSFAFLDARSVYSLCGNVTGLLCAIITALVLSAGIYRQRTAG